MQKTILFMCLNLFVIKTQAQKSAQNQLGTWYMYNGSHQLSKNYKLTTSAHVRYFELIEEYQQEVYRFGLNYNVNNTINFTGGFVYSITDPSYQETSSDLYEYRFYQDLNIKENWKKIKVNHRIRLAQRFKRQDFENSVQHRIRYGLFLNYPISKNWATYGFSEVFFRFQKKAFGQNRTGAGLLRTISKNLKVRFGYFYTKFSKSELHRLQLGIILKTNHIKV